MANEEQRKAFASYMGTAGAAASPQSPQPTAAFANSGNSYLYQQFPGLQGLPTVPTPPPAAPSSVASFPGYQGVVQGGYPQGGFQFGQQQSAFPQRPPPLSQSEAFPSQQSSGYVQVPRSYPEQQTSQPSYNVGWQYSGPTAQGNGHFGSSVATTGAMMPLSRNYQTEILESRTNHMSEQRHFQEHGGNNPSPPVLEVDVPVLLCHTCSVCRRMRSAGYHRNHPVVPGKTPVSSPCRRCKKKIRSRGRSISSFTRVRSCTAEHPCDWPRESVEIDVEIDGGERRGRQRSREKVFIYRRSPSRPRVIRQSSSQTRLGLRVLQHDRGMPREHMNQAKLRVSSLSPHRASRYDGVWLPPDVVPMKPSRPEKPQHMAHMNPNLTSRDEVWPPPDVVRTHAYRRIPVSPLRRQRSRIIELSPSPPPIPRQSSRVEARSEIVERRHRSISPARGRFRDYQQSEAAEARMMAHPHPYRSVAPDRRHMRASDDPTASMDDMSRGRPGSPGRGILKQSGGYRETPRRQMSMRDSQQSTAVEVGGSRVHFDSLKNQQALPVERGRARHADESRRLNDEYEHYHNYSGQRYVDDAHQHDARPPVEGMEHLRVRNSLPLPEQNFEEEIHIDRARCISSSPPSTVEEIPIRSVSPLPRHERDRNRYPPPSPGPPERPLIAGFRHVSSAEVPSRIRLRSPRPVQRRASEDMTDSDRAHSGEMTEVRTWKGIDENGQPATYVEERKTTRMLEQGSERGSHAEFRPMSERLASRSLRDV
ncbi:hypothetical protein DE146DRAFT_625743 [Phaeosphaeria sp. MPI-PUGE-AT-0046c]|nr:hypothetical protein DE146DRAFT_625743 [Phaeosphaeria sp. MPI-PUGE-AT-0046c]